MFSARPVLAGFWPDMLEIFFQKLFFEHKKITGW
jgi:hypothetical protein